MVSTRAVDTGVVFKEPVHCFRCDETFYFTLRIIAGADKLSCPGCGSDINLADRAYRTLVMQAKETIRLIDQSSRMVFELQHVFPRTSLDPI
jgi:hypothetical protein